MITLRCVDLMITGNNLKLKTTNKMIQEHFPRQVKTFLSLVCTVFMLVRYSRGVIQCNKNRKIIEITSDTTWIKNEIKQFDIM